MKTGYPIDVLVLCGGLGTRLRSVIGENQKVLASVDHKPFLELLLRYIQKQKIKRVILCAGYQADALAKILSDAKLTLDIVISKEEKPLGTGGAVKNAFEHIRSDPFFVVNGDSFCRIDYKAVQDFHVAKKAGVTVVLSMTGDGKDFGTVDLDAACRVTAFREKVKSGHGTVNVGIYCCQKKILNFMPPGNAFSMEREVFPQLVGHDFYGFVTDEPFIDIGTPERYQKAQSLRIFDP